MEHSLNDSIMHLLHRASQTADDSFANHFETGDLTVRQFVVMSVIASSAGTSQTAITQATGIDRSTLGDVVGRLQSKGLVSRKRAKHDARVYQIQLTKEGQRVLAAAMPIAERVDDRLAAALPAQKRAEFVRHLRLIAEISMASRTKVDAD